MPYVVVVTPLEFATLASEFFPPTRTARGKHSLYHLYRSDGAVEGTLRDFVDGTALCEMHTFPSAREAERWVEARERVGSVGMTVRSGGAA